jgi:hypothetical protein
MKNYRKYSVAVLFWLFLLHFASAQQFIYKVGYFGFFDNREYFNEYVNDQTIFGSRIYGEIGYSFNEGNRIMAGMDYLYEFGSKGELIAPDITAYYNGRYKNLNLYIGAFPRVNRIVMPMALMTDTFQYYRPNVEGILINYKTPNFRHNIWIDWTGRQSYEKRESFLLGLSGYAKKGMLIYQHHFVMTHLAHSLTHGSDEQIRDNGGYSVMPGIDLSAVTGLDSLTLSAGFLGSYDRIRSVYDFSFPFGFLAEMGAVYKGFGLHGTLYSGESQVIVSGDGFYKSAFYSRADVYYQLTTHNIDGRVQFSFHFIPGTVDLSMSLVVRAQLDGIFKSHQSSSLK